MAKLNYTRGEWFWNNPFEDDEREHKFWNLRCRIDNGDKHILYTHGSIRTEEDAHLIAAAVNACISVNPDNPMAVAESIKEMYEALEYIRETCRAQVNGYLTPDTSIAKLQKALAKAEGGTD